MIDSVPTSLSLLAVDSVFIRVLNVVGLEKEEIKLTLPVFRQQFLTTLFVAVSTYLEDAKVDDYLEKIKAGQTELLGTMAQEIGAENFMGCYFYALKETYGSYMAQIGPALDEDQRDKLKNVFEQMTKELVS